MATKVSKDKFRNMSAAQQQNLTNKTMVDYYLDWTKEAADEVELDDDRDPSEPLEDFDPETKEGSGDVLKMTRELSRNIEGYMTYLNPKPKTMGIYPILSQDFSNVFIKYYYFISSFGEYVGGDFKYNKEHGKEVLDKIIKFDQIENVADLDTSFKVGVNWIIKYYETKMDRLIDLFLERNFQFNRIDVEGDLREYLRQVKLAKDDIIAGKRSFKLFDYQNQYLILPSTVGLNEKVSNVIFSLLKFDKLPSVHTKNTPPLLLLFFEILESYYFDGLPKSLYEPTPGVAQKFTLYLTKINNDFKELDAAYKKFKVETNKYSDDQLRDIKKEIQKITGVFIKFSQDDVFKYLQIDNKYYPNIALNLKLIGKGPAERIAEKSMELYNISFSEFANTYNQLFKNLKQTRSI